MHVLILIVLPILHLPQATSAPVELSPQLRQEKKWRDVRETIAPNAIKSDGGVGYSARLQLQRNADKTSRSVCVLFEDGKPLGPSRALHKDIREKGGGRYSHWTPEVLYFSASDSTDPRSNGRKYELVSREEYIAWSAKVVATERRSSFTITGNNNSTIRPGGMVWRNLDDTVSVTPHLTLYGWPDLRSVPGMVKSVVKPEMTEEQKATALWKFLVDWRYHYYPAEDGPEIHDPVKFLNVYGYGFCDDSAANFTVLSKAAGIRARSYALDGHVVAEAFFDDGWHMFDPDHKVFYRRKDGTIASVKDLESDPTLFTDPAEKNPVATSFSYTPGMANLYTTTGNNRPFDPPVSEPTIIDPRLGPREFATFARSQHGAVHRNTFKDQPLPPVYGNGKLVRKFPDLAQLPSLDNARVLEMDWPYVLIASSLSLNPGRVASKVKVSVSSDGKQWADMKAHWTRAQVEISLDEWLSRRNAANYRFLVKIKMEDGSDPAKSFNAATVVSYFQCAPRAIPSVKAGKSSFELDLGFEEDSVPAKWKGLEVELKWVEILTESPPGTSTND